MPAIPEILVRINDVEDLDPLTARAKVRGVNFDAEPGKWTHYDFSIPYKVNILSGIGFAGFVSEGDKFEFSIIPDTLIGVLTADEHVGSQTLRVGETAILSVGIGYWLKVKSEPTDPDETEYEIIDYNPETRIVALATKLAKDKPAGSLLLMTIRYAEAIELQHEEMIDIGGGTSGSASVPAGVPLRFSFYNAGAETKRVRLRLNLKYQPRKEK